MVRMHDYDKKINFHPAQTGFISSMVFALIGFAVAIVCGLKPSVRDGLEALFLLPISFSVCCFLFSRTFRYWKDSIALTIIFVSIYVRYLVTPLLIALSGTCVSTFMPTPESYRIALVVQIFELVVTLAVIDYIWGRYKKRKRQITLINNNEERKPAEFKLTLFGFVFIFLLLFLVFSRGHLQNVLDHLSTWWSISTDSSDLYAYDMMAIDVAKSAIAITIISVLARFYHKTQSVFVRGVLFILAFAVGLASTVYYQYTQRTALVQLMLSVMAMMISFFPNKRRLLLMVFGVGGAAFVIYIFAIGSMQYEIGGINDNLLEKAAKMAELYVTGPSMLAITRDRYDWVVSNMSISTYFSDIIHSIHIFGLFPVIRNINDLVSGIPTTNQLFVESLWGLTYILPNYSLCTYYVSSIFGWLLEIGSIVLTIKMVCMVDSKKYLYNDACYYYAMAYTEILLGQVVFVNNMFLFFHAFTSLPFWLLMFWAINKLGSRIVIKRA